MSKLKKIISAATAAALLCSAVVFNLPERIAAAVEGEDSQIEPITEISETPEPVTENPEGEPASDGSEQTEPADVDPVNGEMIEPLALDTVDSSEHAGHAICGVAGCADAQHGGHTDITDWTAINDAEGFKTLESGKAYYLTADIELTNAADGDADSTVTIDGKDITLCLNGHSISIQNGVNARIFYIKGGGTLTLCDCDGDGMLTGGNLINSGNGGAVYILSGTFNMYGGTITGNSAYGNGAGVYNAAGATFNMYNGEITGNTVTTSNAGAGVYNIGTFNMHNGKISGNKLEKDNMGFGVCNAGGQFNMYGGEITGNAASDGRNVWISTGTMTIDGSVTIDDICISSNRQPLKTH